MDEHKTLLSERDVFFSRTEMMLSVYQLRELIEIMEHGAGKIPYEKIKDTGKTTGRSVFVSFDDGSVVEYAINIPAEIHVKYRAGDGFWLFTEYWQILSNIANHRWSHDDVLEDLKAYKIVTSKFQE